MKSKGNILTSEVLKMVIAVICIGFLIYFLSALYYSKVNSQKTVEARSSLDLVKSGIINMKLNSLNDFEVLDPSPVDWWVLGFVSPEKKPNLCSGEPCLCICKKPTVLLGNRFEKQLERCDKDGACEIIEGLQDFNEFKLNSSDGNFAGIKFKSSAAGLEVERI